MNNDSIETTIKYLHPDLGRGDFVAELCILAPMAGKKSFWTGYMSGAGKLAAGWYDNPGDLIALAGDTTHGWADGPIIRYPDGVYVGLNPIDPALAARACNRLIASIPRTMDVDVLRRRNLLIDVDAKRPTGICATDEEKKEAIHVARDIALTLEAEFWWPKPLVGDSGNGCHLIYKIDLPNDQDSTLLIKTFLELLAYHFNKLKEPLSGRPMEIRVDTAVFNASRISKLYGTWNCKGENVKDRPWRLSRVLSCPPPELRRIVTEGELREAVNFYLQRKSQVEKSIIEMNAEGQDEEPPDPYAMFDNNWENMDFDLEAYLADNGVTVIGQKAHGTSTLYVLEQCVFNPEHGKKESAIGRTAEGKLFYQCFHDSCKEKTWRDVREAITGKERLTKWMHGKLGSKTIKFPHVQPKTGKPTNRISNLRVLLDNYDIRLRYNEMTRSQEISLPGGLWKNSDNQEELGRALIIDMCHAYGMPSSSLSEWLQIIAEEKTYHPIREWIESCSWDKVDRISALAETVEVDDACTTIWPIYLRRWLIQCVAALYDPFFSGRGVLVLSGPQNIGKTSWFRALCPSPYRNAFGEGMLLNPLDKDSILGIIKHWIVELGELDATFRKADIARIKAFVSAPSDKVRKPYGRETLTFKRRTSLAATVNDLLFLQDPTGNSRWWTVLVRKPINWAHGLDMQQVWAQAREAYLSKESWFLNPDEMKNLTSTNKMFEITDPIEDMVSAAFNFEAPRSQWTTGYTGAEILAVIGSNRTKGEASRLGGYLSGTWNIRRVKRGAKTVYLMPPRVVFKRDDLTEELEKVEAYDPEADWLN